MNLINIIDKIDKFIYQNYRGKLPPTVQLEHREPQKLVKVDPYEWNRVINTSKQKEIFDEIIGYPDIKQILKNMIDSIYKNNTPVSILLDGSAGCGKSMFLKAIERAHKDESYYIDGSKATKAGIFNVLFEDKENQIKFLIIDEIDKLAIDDQESLLTLIEDGRLIQTQKNGTFDKTYDNLSVIAASNDKSNMLYPLLTRFFKIKVKDYTKAQFREIGERVLEQYNLYPTVIDYIITKVEQQPKPNIRTLKQIGKLCNNSAQMVNLLLENSG